MDPRSADYIRHRMVRFSESIDETRKHFSSLSPVGRYPASAPYYEKTGILQLLDSLDDGSGVREILCRNFRQIKEKLENLEEERGLVYRTLLREELSFRLDVYAAAVCHASLGCVTFEPDHDLFRRDLIAVLVDELEKDHDLTCEKHLIRTLDANLFPSGTGEGNEFAGRCRRSDEPAHGIRDSNCIEI